jgi:hypothetical protein
MQQAILDGAQQISSSGLRSTGFLHQRSFRLFF